MSSTKLTLATYRGQEGQQREKFQQKKGIVKGSRGRTRDPQMGIGHQVGGEMERGQDSTGRQLLLTQQFQGDLR